MRKLIIFLSLVIHSLSVLSQEYVYVLRSVDDVSGYYYSEYQIDTTPDYRDSVVIFVKDTKGHPTAAVIVFNSLGMRDTFCIGKSGKMVMPKEHRDRYTSFRCVSGIIHIQGYWFQQIEYDEETGVQVPYGQEVLTIVLPEVDPNSKYIIRSPNPISHDEMERIRRDLSREVDVTKKYKKLKIEPYFEL